MNMRYMHWIRNFAINLEFSFAKEKYAHDQAQSNQLYLDILHFNFWYTSGKLQ